MKLQTSIFLFVVSLSLILSVAQSAWTHRRKDNQNSAALTDPTCSSIANPPVIKWRRVYENSFSSQNPILLSGDESTIYTFLGSDLAALSFDTGNIKWIFSLPYSYSAMVGPSGNIYVLNNFLSCVEPANGELVWSLPDTSYYETTFLVDSQERIYYSLENTVRCVNGFDGTILWSQPISIYNAFSLTAPALSTDEATVYFLTQENTDYHLFSIATATGAISWTANIPSASSATPALLLNDQLGLVFLSEVSGEVHAIRTADGVEEWSFKSQFTPTTINNALILGGPQRDILIVATGYLLYGLTASTGAVSWRKNLVSPINHDMALGPNGNLYLPRDEGLQIINPTNGAVVNGTSTSSQTLQVGSPALTSNGEMIVLSLGRLARLKLCLSS